MSVSGDTDTVNVSYDASELEYIICDRPVKSQYSLSLLYPMVKRMEAIVDYVTLSFNENHPAKLEFEFANGHGTVNYWLAPFVEDA